MALSGRGGVTRSRFRANNFCCTANQGGISHGSVAETLLSRRAHRHMRASFCTAQCDISPSPKDRTVRCGSSKAAVMMLLF